MYFSPGNCYELYKKEQTMIANKYSTVARRSGASAIPALEGLRQENRPEF